MSGKVPCLMPGPLAWLTGSIPESGQNVAHAPQTPAPCPHLGAQQELKGPSSSLGRQVLLLCNRVSARVLGSQHPQRDNLRDEGGPLLPQGRPSFQSPSTTPHGRSSSSPLRATLPWFVLHPLLTPALGLFPQGIPAREVTRDSHSPAQSLRWVPTVYPVKAKQSRSVRRSPHNLFSPLLQCSVLFPGLSPEHFPSGRIGALPFLEQGLYFVTFTFVHTVASSWNALLHYQHGDLVHTSSPVLRELLEAISESRDI